MLHSLIASNAIPEIKEWLSVPTNNVNETDGDGLTGLHVACSTGNTRVVDVLLAHDAQVDCMNAQGWTPLHFACREASFAAVKALAKAGASNNLITKDTRQTPLQLACGALKPSVPADVGALSQLFERGDQAILLHVDANGQTALHIAVLSRSLDAVQLLIRGNRHIINAVNKEGQTPLFLAIRQKSTDILTTLVLSGAAVGIADAQGQQASTFAEDSVKKLLQQQRTQSLGQPHSTSHKIDRFCFSFCTDNDRAFLIGGWNGSSANEAEYQSSVLRISLPSMDSSEIPIEGNSSTSSLADAASVCKDNRLLLFGGMSGFQKSNGQIWMLDLSSEPHTWKAVGLVRAPLSIYGQKTVLIGDNAYFFAANNADYWNEVHTFNINSLEWSSAKTNVGPTPRLHHSVSFVDEGVDSKTPVKYILIFGGEMRGGTITNELWRFHLENRIWEHITPSGPVPSPRIRHAAALYQGSLWIHGGEGGSRSILNDVTNFSLTKNQWTECISSKPLTPRYGHVAILQKNKIYFIGGTGTSPTEQLDLAPKQKNVSASKSSSSQLQVETESRYLCSTPSRSKGSRRSFHQDTLQTKSKHKRPTINTPNPADSVEVLSYVHMVRKYLETPTPELKTKISAQGDLLVKQIQPTTRSKSSNDDPFTPAPLQSFASSVSMHNLTRKEKPVPPGRKHLSEIVVPRANLDLSKFTNVRRFYAVKELMSTEADYLTDLAFLVSFFVKPIKADVATGSKQIGITEFYIKALFKNVEEIFALNLRLQNELIAEISKPEADQLLGQVFLNNAEDISKQYKIYNTNVSGADSTLSRLLVENQHFASFVENSLREPEARSQMLDSFIIKPYQRITRYPILLKRILTTIREGTAEYEKLHKAATVLSNTAESTSKVKKSTETMIEVVGIQNRFVISKQEDKELLALHRHSLVQQGHVKEQDGRKTRKVILYLFNDIIVVAKEKGANLIRRHFIYLNTCTVESVQSKHGKHALLLNYKNPKKENSKALLVCTSCDERDSWVKQIGKQQSTST